MQTWFETKAKYVKIDEAAGREKKVNNYLLVSADDLEQAVKNNLGIIFIRF